MAMHVVRQGSMWMVMMGLECLAYFDTKAEATEFMLANKPVKASAKGGK